jgi:hypothetical protein
LTTKEFIFLLSIFVEKLSNFLRFFGAARIRNDYSGSGTCQQFRIRPDPDPQHWFPGQYQNREIKNGYNNLLEPERMEETGEGQGRGEEGDTRG